MTYTEIQKALARHMGQWPGRVDVPVWINGAIIPESVSAARDGPTKVPWVRFNIIWSKAFTAGVGSQPCRRIPGIITAEIYYPEPVFDSTTTSIKNPALETLAIADSIAEHFQYWGEDKITTEAASVVNVDDEADWYRQNVVVDFDAE